MKIYQRILSVIVETKKKKSKKRSKKPGSGGVKEAPEASAEQGAAAKAELKKGLIPGEEGPISRAREALGLPEPTKRQRKRGLPSGRGHTTREMP